MPDLRELFDPGPDEGFRTMFAALQRHMHTSMVARVTQASPDGHAVQVQPVVQQPVQDRTLMQTTFQDYPIIPDAVVHFPGGAGATLTHGFSVGDELLVNFAGRGVDFWRQNGGTQQPPSDRMHSLSDAVASGSVRSDPRRLAQVAPDAMHLRDDAKHAVHEVKPGTGVQSFHADPSTAPASASFDPLSMASKFVRHLAQSSVGAVGQAVDGDTVHDHGSFHGVGSWLQSMGGLHKVIATPVSALLSAFGGKHSVTADAGGLSLKSATAIALQCPPGGLGLPAGGVSAGALAAGAASSNVGALSGDLSGELPSPTVTGVLNVMGADKLPVAANDAAAAALNPPVPIGSLYRNGSALMVRVA